MSARDDERNLKKMEAALAKEHERAMIKRAIKAIERSVENHDMQTVIVLVELCKYIAGDDFEVTIESED